MMTSFILLAWSVLLLYGVSGYRLVCVYTNWSQYRPEGGKFLPEDIDPSMCTHIIYVYAKLQGNRLAAAEWNDDGTAWKEGMYQRVNALKQLNPDLKTILGVGGWMMGSKDFSRMASTGRSRRMFAKSAVTFLRERGFDGLTIDWQHPTKRGGRPKDRVNFSLLLRDVRREFEDEGNQTNQPPLLLVAGVSASKYIIDSAYEIQNISKYTDFINVFAYDLHGPWDNYTGHPSQLYARDDELGPAAEINVDTSMKYWISNGVDRSKLVLGISSYGRTFTLKEPRYNGYMVPTSGPGNAGEFTREPGMIAYYERCNQYFDAPRIWDKQSKVAYWYSGDQWIAGEDIESVKHKVNWVRHNGVGGVMLSSFDMDDFSGLFCTGDFYPLLESINSQFTAPLEPLNHGVKTAKDRNRDIVIPSSTFDPVLTNEQFTDTTMFDASTESPATSAIPETTTAPSFRAQTEPSIALLPIFNRITRTLPPRNVAIDSVNTQTSQNNKRNERLINDLLNIFKLQSMTGVGNTEQNLWSQGPITRANRFGRTTVQRNPGVGTLGRRLDVRTTTSPSPFTVHPWNTFRMQPDVPQTVFSDNKIKPV